MLFTGGIQHGSVENRRRNQVLHKLLLCTPTMFLLSSGQLPLPFEIKPYTTKLEKLKKQKTDEGRMKITETPTNSTSPVRLTLKYHGHGFLIK